MWAESDPNQSVVLMKRAGTPKGKVGNSLRSTENHQPSKEAVRGLRQRLLGEHGPNSYLTSVSYLPKTTVVLMSCAT